MIPSKVLTSRGYSIAKADLSAKDIADIETQLTVTPYVPPSYAGGVSPFRIWISSPQRYYLPRAWAISKFGDADSDVRSEGDPLPSGLKFQGTLRQHQTEALTAFENAGHNGIICLPCGYGKPLQVLQQPHVLENVSSSSFIKSFLRISGQRNYVS